MDDLTNLTQFIHQQGDELVTDTRAVAIVFRKNHRDVLRTVSKMLDSQHPEIKAHAQRNFALSSYTDSTGRKLTMYRMTAEGLQELAMGFTGDLARIVRIRFLAAFKAVAQRLANAEKSITERLLEFDRRETRSRVKGQIGSKLMHERRREKPDLSAEQTLLQSIAQPTLLLSETH